MKSLAPCIYRTSFREVCEKGVSLPHIKFLIVMKRILYSMFLAAVLCVGCAKTENDDTGKKPDDMTDGVAYVGSVSVTQDDGSVFTKEDVEVIMTASGNTADMKMLKVKFASAMPIELDMTVRGIAYERKPEGYVISGNDLIPIAMGGEFPAYTITGLSGTAANGMLTFSMRCGKYPLQYSGERK